MKKASSRREGKESNGSPSRNTNPKARDHTKNPSKRFLATFKAREEQEKRLFDRYLGNTKQRFLRRLQASIEDANHSLKVLNNACSYSLVFLKEQGAIQVDLVSGQGEVMRTLSPTLFFEEHAKLQRKARDTQNQLPSHVLASLQGEQTSERNLHRLHETLYPPEYKPERQEMLQHVCRVKHVLEKECAMIIAQVEELASLGWNQSIVQTTP